MRNSFFVFCLVTLIVSPGYCQNQEIVDSLNRVLEATTGADRYLPLYELAFEYIDRDNGKVLEIVKQAEQSALLSGDSLWIVKCKRVETQMLARLQRLPESIRIGEVALGIASRNNFVQERTMILNSLAGSYIFLGSENIGLKYLFETLEISESVRDSSAFAQALNNIGFFYFRFKDYKKALNYLLRSFEVTSAIGELGVLQLNNISQCYAVLGDLANAKRFLRKNREACDLEGCTERSIAQLTLAEGLILYKSGKFMEAERKWLEAYSIAQNSGSLRIQLYLISGLAELYEKQGLNEKLLSVLRNAEPLIELAYNINRQELLEIYSVYFRTCHSLGDFETAAYYGGLYIELKDSIYNGALTASLMETEANFLERQNFSTIDAQNEIIGLKEQAISRQRTLNIVTGCLTIAVIILLGFVAVGYLQKQKFNKLLLEKIGDRTRELELNRDLLVRIIKEKNMEAHRLSLLISETVKTIVGLCNTAILEVSAPSAFIYFSKIEKALDRLKKR